MLWTRAIWAFCSPKWQCFLSDPVPALHVGEVCHGGGVQTISTLFIRARGAASRFAIEYEILDMSLDALIGCLEQE